jgi:SAM-dependent methyltransferase
MATSADELREEVRRRYAESARAVIEGSGDCGCGSGSCCEGDDATKFGEALYDAEQRGKLPDSAALASLGCGNPTAVADLAPGETVLDLGSGGGIDVILSARRVGPTGLAYGLDMTDEMLALARRNRGRRRKRDLSQGGDRTSPAAGGICRRCDLELRDQSLDG